MPLNHYASSSLTETLQTPKNIPLVPAAVLPRDRLIGNNVAFSFANPPVNKKLFFIFKIWSTSREWKNRYGQNHVFYPYYFKK